MSRKPARLHNYNHSFKINGNETTGLAIWSEIKTRNTKWYGRDAGVQFLKFYFRPKFDGPGDC